MKKFLSLLLIFCAGFSIMLAGCGKKDNVIRLNEVTHSIFYAPLYAAINKGYFEEYGIEIELTNGGGADKSMAALVSGGADIGLMGPEACIYVAAQGKKDMPKIFAQLTKRDGSFLVGREDVDDFDWKDLEGKEILGGRRGGVPAMALEYALKQNGLINGENVTINYDVEFNSMAAAFQSGVADYVTIFEPTASEIEANNRGYIVASVGEEVGEVPFTAFMASENYLKNNKDKIKNFIKAVMKGYEYVVSTDVTEVARTLLPSFNGSSLESIVASLNSYIRIDAWVSNPIMQKSSFELLQTIMKNAGELRENVSYESIVDNSFAEEVLNELK